MSVDKRLIERFEILGQLDGAVRVASPVAVRQVSLGGALVETVFPLTLGALHEFRLTLPDRSVVVRARVAHSHISDVSSESVSYHSGVEFIDMTPPVLDVIRRYVDSLRRGA